MIIGGSTAIYHSEQHNIPKYNPLEENYLFFAWLTTFFNIVIMIRQDKIEQHYLSNLDYRSRIFAKIKTFLKLSLKNLKNLHCFKTFIKTPKMLEL